MNKQNGKKKSNISKNNDKSIDSIKESQTPKYSKFI